MLADMAMGIEAGRLLTYKSAFEIDNVSDGSPLDVVVSVLVLGVVLSAFSE